jgi:hypothetical protein
MRRLGLSLAVIISTFLPLPAPVQQSEKWSGDLGKMLNEFMSCQDKADDKSPCNRFVGKALRRVYNVDDFGPDEKGEYLDANTIAGYLATSDKWIFLGSADSQKVLNEAEEYANQGKALVAVKSDDPNGHVALILPGDLSASNTWNGLRCPNSASFFLKHPEKSYVGKKLSYAFDSPVGVKIYGREVSK